MSRETRPTSLFSDDSPIVAVNGVRDMVAPDRPLPLMSTAVGVLFPSIETVLSGMSKYPLPTAASV